MCIIPHNAFICHNESDTDKLTDSLANYSPQQPPLNCTLRFLVVTIATSRSTVQLMATYQINLKPQLMQNGVAADRSSGGRWTPHLGQKAKAERCTPVDAGADEADADDDEDCARGATSARAAAARAAFCTHSPNPTSEQYLTYILGH